MVRRRTLALVLLAGGAILIVVAVAALALRDGGARDESAGDLAWGRSPRVFNPERLPRDRVLSARLRNDSLRSIRLSVDDLRLEDANGRTVDSTAVFLDSFVHGLYPPTRQPAQISESELRRTGRLAVLRPGDSVPLTVAWRRVEDAGAPARLDYGRGSLALPAE
jgi:hypothetical protein